MKVWIISPTLSLGPYESRFEVEAPGLCKPTCHQAVTVLPVSPWLVCWLFMYVTPQLQIFHSSCRCHILPSTFQAEHKGPKHEVGFYQGSVFSTQKENHQRLLPRPILFHWTEQITCLPNFFIAVISVLEQDGKLVDSQWKCQMVDKWMSYRQKLSSVV